MTYTVFYSWQSDATEEHNRIFIRDALRDAIAGITSEAAIEESPRFDSGMEGIAGTPEVATIMFEKIDACSIFVADTTLVGSIPARAPDKAAKKAPNPNVSLEMGYAAGKIGWGRIICVMNEAYGKRGEQPFDVRNRRFPINYTLSEDNFAQRAEQKANLTRWLRFAIETVASMEDLRVDSALRSLDINCLNLVDAVWQHDCFQLSDPGASIMGGTLDTYKFTVAINRLLDLRLIETRPNAEQPHSPYFYCWTHLGKQLLIKLGKRSAPSPPALR